MSESTLSLLQKTKAAQPYIARLKTEDKNRLLSGMADALVASTEKILAANRQDIEKARGTVSDVMLDRLALTENRIADMAQGMRRIASLPDPVGEDISVTERPNGLKIRKRRVPLGLVAIIYESRPNVTSDAACLALKSGNACILRCGKEAYESCKAIVDALKEGLLAFGANADILNLVSEAGRESAKTLMTADGLVDLLIPRGGAGLISACVREATVPCIQTGTGICHIYIDRDADIEKALAIVNNAKTSRPSVCNAAEVCLVHTDIAAAFLPRLQELLVNERIAEGKIPVELRLDEKSAAIIDGKTAGANDFDTEFLDYILAVKTVENEEEAIAHIARHSTGHSEAIITENASSAEEFVASIDSAAVYVNASTRFTDGGEFGFGCEMGISTQKLHARGPMGLCELTTYKYVIEGNGQVR